MKAQVNQDSFDDDLNWILERLVERAGATGGLILRFSDGGADSRLLACHALDVELPGATLDRLCDVVRMAPPWEGVQKLTADLGSEVHPRYRLLALRFKPAPGVIVVAAVCRPEHSFNMLQEYVAGRLEPVLARYVRLWWMHRTERRRAAIFQTAIDSSDLGIVMLDRRGRLLYSNPAADLLLRCGDGLRRSGSGIATADSAHSHCLSQALQRAADAVPDPEPVHNVASTLLTLPRTGKRSLIVSVVAVNRPVVDAADAAVVLYLLDPENDVTALLAPAFRIYRLTATEARLVARLVGGADLTDAAASMNLAVQTARSYMKQIFLKTSTNRQAELVRVMCGSAARAAMLGEFSQP